MQLRALTVTQLMSSVTFASRKACEAAAMAATVGPMGLRVPVPVEWGALAVLAVATCPPQHAGTTLHATEIGKQAGIGRMTMDKIWSGDIQGTSKGEMLTGITASTGSMAYTAVEQMTVTLAGRSGSFYFMHRATMMKGDAGSASMDVTVVPNSGTGQLAGLTGSLKIDAAAGHRYDFTYELP